ncbi:MAG TPA: inositol monophosphatase family protein [Thermoanaerobaculia bacterium]|nr:inositol monophosphatase family protein [Thermoanaerobaculia bacterium]
MTDYRELMSVAVRAAEAAGELLRTNARPQIISDHEHDVKIDADLRAEAVIIDQIRQQSGAPILTEESGDVAGTSSTDLRWIVDPLDGTYNYFRGIPLAAVSIAVWRGDSPLIGVVHDFFRNEMFRGVVGEGAWLNDTPIGVRTETSTRSSVLCTGVPAADDFSADALIRFASAFRDYKKVRLVGSAALSLAWLAAGRVDEYRENNIKLWDVAAGLALVRAAGGSVEMTPSDARHAWKVRATGAGARTSLL